MKDALVTVIIPAFNCENTILDTIYSVINQTINNIEIILINNNSTDKTLDKVKTISDDRIQIYNCKKQHPSAARNLGIKKSSAKIIAFLDADDIWFKNKLEKSLEALKKNDFVYHDLYIYKKNEFKYLYKGVAKTRTFTNPVKNDLIINGNGINHSSVVLKKSLLLKAGLYDESKNIFAVEDYELWIRISEHTQSFKKIKETLGKSIITGDNISLDHKKKYIYSKELHARYCGYMKKELKTDMAPWMAYNFIIYGFINNKFSNFISYYKKVNFLRLDFKKKIKLTLIFIKFVVMNLSHIFLKFFKPI